MKHIHMVLQPDRSVTATCHLLGVEGDNRCECLRLKLPLVWGEQPLEETRTELTLKVGDYRHTVSPAAQEIEQDALYLTFPVTAAMVARHGDAKIEFLIYKEDLSFVLHTRPCILSILTPLDGGADVENSDPALLAALTERMGSLEDNMTQYIDARLGVIADDLY